MSNAGCLSYLPALLCTPQLSLPACSLVATVQAGPFAALLLAHELWPTVIPSHRELKQVVDSTLVLDQTDKRRELVLSLGIVLCLGLAQTLAVAASGKRKSGG